MKLLFKKKLKVVLATGWYILGNEVKEFETSFASIAGHNITLVQKWSGCSGFDF
jgi:dTDP-4-amino-4,6-dideoxygalactose transaminase